MSELCLFKWHWHYTHKQPPIATLCYCDLAWTSDRLQLLESNDLNSHISKTVTQFSIFRINKGKSKIEFFIFSLHIADYHNFHRHIIGFSPIHCTPKPTKSNQTIIIIIQSRHHIHETARLTVGNKKKSIKLNFSMQTNCERVSGTPVHWFYYYYLFGHNHCGVIGAINSFSTRLEPEAPVFIHHSEITHRATHKIFSAFLIRLRFWCTTVHTRTHNYRASISLSHPLASAPVCRRFTLIDDTTIQNTQELYSHDEMNILFSSFYSQH